MCELPTAGLNKRGLITERTAATISLYHNDSGQWPAALNLEGHGVIPTDLSRVLRPGGSFFRVTPERVESGKASGRRC